MGKIFVIVLDGAADRSISSLSDQTPLEAAETPALDTLAKESRQGMVTVIDPDIWPESDSGAMAILSYDPMEFYTGRGPLEGLGLDFVEPDGSSAAFRVNFASFNASTKKLDRRTARGLSPDELEALAESIRREVDLGDISADLKLLAYGRHRGILALRSHDGAISGQVTNTDPGFRNEGPFGIPVAGFDPVPLLASPRNNTKGARRAAGIVNVFVERSAAVLRSHPVNLARAARGDLEANIILVRDGGDAPRPLPRFTDRFGCTISLFGQIPAERGLSMLIGGDFAYSVRDREESEEDYLGRAVGEVTGARSDVVFIHLKGPDEPGHDGLPDEKVRAIELIDRHFVAPLLTVLHDDDVIAVTSDHATPCELGIHSADQVATAVRGPAIVPDGTVRFGERFAADGSLGITRAIELMPLLVAARNPG